MSTRPFRFGAKATKAKSAKEWTDLARQAEDLGYASFQMDDHFGNQLATVPALMSAADATSKIQVGPHVAGVDFRNPVVFAKECATIDLLSEGRFTLGIGAGWSNKDYAIAGIRQDDASTRIERLGEAVTIMKGLWGEGPFSFDGQALRGGRGRRRAQALLAHPGHDRRRRTEDPRAGRPAGRHRGDQPEDRRPLDQPPLDGHHRGRHDGREGGLGQGGGGRPLRRPRAAAPGVRHRGDRRPAGRGREARRRPSACRPRSSSARPSTRSVPSSRSPRTSMAIRERWGISYILFQPTAWCRWRPVVAKLSGT